MRILFFKRKDNSKATEFPDTKERQLHAAYLRGILSPEEYHNALRKAKAK